MLAARRDLERIYEEKTASPHVSNELSAMKKEAIERFRSRYARLREQWLEAPGAEPRQFAGYDFWVAHANNARFGAMAAYDELVPEFEALFEREGHDWPRFYDAVSRLAEMPKVERERQLALRKGAHTVKPRIGLNEPSAPPIEESKCLQAG